MQAFQLLFWIFGTMTLVGAVFMLFTRNVLHAALALVFTFLSLAGLYVIFNAPYLAIVQLMVYAGGVIVLLAFGIMLTNRSAGGKPFTQVHLWFPALALAVAFVWVIVAGIRSGGNQPTSVLPTADVHIAEIGKSLMTTYILPFELIAYLLLVVLVGAAIFAKDNQEA